MNRLLSCLDLCGGGGEEMKKSYQGKTGYMRSYMVNGLQGFQNYYRVSAGHRFLSCGMD